MAHNFKMKINYNSNNDNADNNNSSNVSDMTQYIPQSHDILFYITCLNSRTSSIIYKTPEVNISSWPKLMQFFDDEVSPDLKKCFL